MFKDGVRPANDSSLRDASFEVRPLHKPQLHMRNTAHAAHITPTTNMQSLLTKYPEAELVCQCLRASRSFAWTALDLFYLTTAKLSKVCLVQTKAFDVVGVIYF
jgi:hypothetical protein